MNYHTLGLNYDYPVYRNTALVTKSTIDLAYLLDQLFPCEIGLVCTGTSGLTIALAVECRRRQPSKILFLRKPGEESHSDNNELIRPSTPSILVIVDDHLSTGITLRRIINALYDKNIDVKALCLSTGNSFPQLEERFKYLINDLPNLNHIIL